MSDFDSDLRWVWYRETVCRVPNGRGTHCECGEDVWDYYTMPGQQRCLCKDCFDSIYRKEYTDGSDPSRPD